jgi:uncharacterized membrane protein YebE (DUF533 family)
MSFIRTLATLAAGYAAAKGHEKFKDMGGMAGLQNAGTAGASGAGGADLQSQMGDMMSKLGIPGGSGMLGQIMGQLGGGAAGAGTAGAAGLGGLMSALGGAAAAGSESSAQMMDAFTGTTAATSTMEDNAKLMISAMIQAAKADGEIDGDEQAKILEQMGELDAEERAFIEAELAKPVDVQSLAMATSEQMKAQVYAMSVMAIRVDTNSEVSYLNTLAAALGLSDETRAQVHKAMGIG